MAEYLAGLLLLTVTAAEDIREKKISVCTVTVFAIAAVIYHMVAGEFYWQKVIADMLPGGMLVLISLLTGESIGYGLVAGRYLYIDSDCHRDYDFGNLRSDLSFEEEV